MNRPGLRQVPEGSGEQGKMEKTGCKIICGAPTTLAVKGLMMMMTSLTRRSQSELTMPLHRHSEGTCQETLSHATRQEILGHSRRSSLRHCWPILALRVELVCKSQSPHTHTHTHIHTHTHTKDAGGKWMIEHSLKVLASEKKATTTTSLFSGDKHDNKV